MGFCSMREDYPTLPSRAAVPLRKHGRASLDLTQAVVCTFERHHPPSVGFVVAASLEAKHHAELCIDVYTRFGPTIDGAPHFDVSIER